MYSASLSDVGMAVTQGSTTYSPIIPRSSYNTDQKNAVRYASYVPKKQRKANKWFLSFSIMLLVVGAVELYRITRGESFSLKIEARFGERCGLTLGQRFRVRRAPKEPLAASYSMESA
jgi:hypothetical protein